MDSTDQLIVRLLNNPKKLLATILILNNTINIAIVTLSTYAVSVATGVSTVEGKFIVGLTFVVTFLIVFFGELVPKVYANQNNYNFIRKTARFIAIARTFFTPVSAVLMGMNTLIEKRIRTRGYEVSRDELQMALDLTTQQESSEDEMEILQGIINFSSLTVKQVMRSRVDFTAFETNMNFHELLEEVNKSGYSRIPVFHETIDNIDGILYIKDLIPYINKDKDFDWIKLLREAYFIPENKKIDILLRNFQERRIHMAIVVDEYGGTSGLITLEDIIEEIVGEINDEFDGEDIAYSKLDEQTYLFEGKTTLIDVCKILEESSEIFDEVKGESESLGGLILELSTKMPGIGEKVSFDKFVFTVVAVDQKRIKRVRVFTAKPSQYISEQE
jgi:magnesium and cobalt exporter, CNNM family